MTDYKNDEKTLAQFILDTMPSNIEKLIVDVGANDNADFSEYFVKQNTDWKLILIEPNPECINNLKIKYPEQIIVQKACSDKTEISQLFLGNGSTELSTLNVNSDPWLDMVRSEQTIDVQLDTLTNILLDNNCPKEIGVLKIDAETHDPFVLKGFDFNLFSPMYIVTEEYYWEPENLKLKYNILNDAGYILLGYVNYNSLWIKKTDNINYPYLLLNIYKNINLLNHNNICGLFLNSPKQV